MIFVLDLLELASILVIFLVVITQMIIPIFRGLPMFPILGKETRLEVELAEVKEETHVVELQNKITEERERVAALRGPNKNTTKETN